MKKLPHNCRVGKMSVYPKTKQKVQIRKKGMNDLHVWEDRKDITIKLMSIPRELSKKNTVKATRILLTPDQKTKVKRENQLLKL